MSEETAPVGRIKPLCWVEAEHGYVYCANSGGGASTGYVIEALSGNWPKDERFVLFLYANAYWIDRPPVRLGMFSSLDEAKYAAQIHHENQILSDIDWE
jgi:hypothetical protein